MFGHGMRYPVSVASNRPEWHRVVGELTWFKDDLYDEVLARLDLPEGCFGAGDRRNMYDRLTVTADYADGGMFQTPAWCYVGNPDWRSRLRQQNTPIASGDWLDREDADPGTRCLVCGDAHDDAPLVLHHRPTAASSTPTTARASVSETPTASPSSSSPRQPDLVGERGWGDRPAT